MLTKLPCEPRQLSLLLILLLFSTAYAVQRTASTERDDKVTLRSRRVVLVRTGEHARQFPERSRATVIYPEVLGLEDPTVLARVRAMLEIKNVFGSSLKEYRDDGWLTDFNYKTNYNRNYILDITFTQSGMGAYPDEHTKHFLINLRDGRPIKASDAFDSAKLKRLATRVDREFQQELKEIGSANSGSSDRNSQGKSWGNEALENQKFSVQNLDEFSVGRQGITFLYDAAFPHAIKAFEPRGHYFFSYSELKPYIKRDGPLGQFVD